MIDEVGIIGVGHLAGYLVEGLTKASKDMKIILSPRNRERSARLAKRFKAIVAGNNQEVVDKTDLIILSTRFKDVTSVIKSLSFRSGQTVISVAPYLLIDILKPIIFPANVIRAMPISSVAINQSPTLLHPDHYEARALFSLLGQVLVLKEESHFTSASVIAAFYGWIHALLDETINWTVQTGVPRKIAWNLVLETVRSAVNMNLSQPDMDLGVVLNTLATPGGITEQGLNVLHQQQGLTAWVKALEAVLIRMHDNQGDIRQRTSV
ncbi:MAG: NAD(P)-binding domain-containing protein [Candidatus Hodarchaeales archaeon]|jgi:pyrroline-5-carboxylate reductase